MGICLLPGQGGLAGRGHPSRGNVYVGGKPICDDSWSNNSAAVICRELGWETGWATKESHFGPVHADFVLTNVQCNVQDRRLSACSNTTTPTALASCGMQEGAGVLCSSQPSIAGQPRSSRVVTNMLLLAILVAGVLLTYWKRDWVKARVQDYRSGERRDFSRETEGGIVNRGYASGGEE